MGVISQLIPQRVLLLEFIALYFAPSLPSPKFNYAKNATLIIL